MHSPLTIAITGANGFLGSALTSWFISKGYHVIAMVRNIPEQRSPNVTYILFDLSKGQCEKQNIPADVLIHAAYVPATDANAYESNINGTRALLRLFSPSVLKIFISSISADADSRAVYGRQKAELEKLFLNENGTAIRPGLILGNGGMFGKMRSYLQKKRNIPLFNGGIQPVQTVYVNDLALAIEQIITKNLSGVYTFCEHEPVHYREFYSELCRQIGVQPRFISIPYWVAGCLITCAKVIGVTLPINRDNLEGLRNMKAHPSIEDAKRIGVIPEDYRNNLRRSLNS
jgi:nucleoside-diphosphate-sugar epimerase